MLSGVNLVYLDGDHRRGTCDLENVLLKSTTDLNKRYFYAQPDFKVNGRPINN